MLFALWTLALRLQSSTSPRFSRLPLAFCPLDLGIAPAILDVTIAGIVVDALEEMAVGQRRLGRDALAGR